MVQSDSVRAPHASTPGSTLFGLYIVALAVSLGGNLVMRLAAGAGWLSPAGQVALAVVASGPLAVAAAMFWRLLRRDLDEMLQRVVLEGLAFALVLYVPLAALYVNLRTAGVWMPRLDPPDILLVPAWLAMVGFILAWRRYQ